MRPFTSVFVAAELKEKLESEVEKNAQLIETLKRDWESERELCLENLRKELSEKHRSELENLQSQFKKGLAEQKAELEKVSEAKSQAECALQDLETRHQAALRQLQEELQSQHCQSLEDLGLKHKEKEEEKQLEVGRAHSRLIIWFAGRFEKIWELGRFTVCC
ncbi:pericentrin-like [Trichechus manatus latirostris]|uniref:Pericentrin-like n=1 Tax=Trichechus manatus latirostris TaxID=127582 RepID=A0A2Y9RSH8_TRIMA|nr:pericentrin-like [Trichechus manatus latirostris]